MTRETVRMADEERISATIIDAVSVATGTDPLELPLAYEAIDLDAVDRLYRSARGRDRSGVDLRFHFAGCEVRVRGSGRVVAVPHRAEADRRAASTG